MGLLRVSRNHLLWRCDVLSITGAPHLLLVRTITVEQRWEQLLSDLRYESLILNFAVQNVKYVGGVGGKELAYMRPTFFLTVLGVGSLRLNSSSWKSASTRRTLLSLISLVAEST